MSTDAMRAALNEVLNKEAVYGEVPGLQRPTEFALASYYWRVIGDMKRVARAALAQPTSAERVPLTDEQLTDIWNASLLKSQSVYAFARAIERAHGIGEPK